MTLYLLGAMAVASIAMVGVDAATAQRIIDAPMAPGQQSIRVVYPRQQVSRLPDAVAETGRLVRPIVLTDRAPTQGLARSESAGLAIEGDLMLSGF